MKKTLIATICGLGLALTASTSQALTLTIGDGFYLGSVDPGPGNPTEEAQLLNDLLDFGDRTLNPGTPQQVVYSRNEAVSCGLCPDPTAVGSIGDDTVPIQSTNIDVTNWTYLKVKYGNGSYFWYVANIDGPVDILTTIGQGGGLSHWLLFNPTPSVPDGGATLGLLGLGMLGLGYLRRRNHK